MNAFLFPLLLCAVAAEPDKPATAPPEIRLSNSATDIEFGVSVLLDTTPSTGVHRMKWSVWPEKYEANLVEIAPGKTLFTCTLPGRYVFYGAASNTAGDLTTLRHSVRILPPGQELLESMKRDAEGLRATPASFERPTAEPPRQAIQQPEDFPGLRAEVLKLLDKVQSHARDSERALVAAGYDKIGTEFLAKRPDDAGQSRVMLGRALADLEGPVQEKWRPFSVGIGEAIGKRAREGAMPNYEAYVRALGVVEDVLGEGR